MTSVNLNYLLKVHLQIQSHWGLGFQMIHFGEMQFSL